ncbi:MAG TPA: hypothetical protein VIF15_07115, partial [Polyangiaceae bacterium]
RKSARHPPGVGESDVLGGRRLLPRARNQKGEKVIMNGNRITQVAADQKLADGLTMNAALIGTFTIDGKQLKPADVVQVLQGRVTAANAATTARAGLKAAAEAAKTELANTRVLIVAVKQALRLIFGKDINTLATFGLAPRKQTTPKPATKVAATTKAKATRTARGTKGKKQKLAIKAPAAPQGAAEAATPPAPATTPAPANRQ